jgi:imidazole glycerol phosphate synthase glutamine amidotransferase subunit
MVGIIDCKIGNIGSLHNAISYLGAQVEVIRHPDDLKYCQAVVLPGVGAFDPAMTAVECSGFAAAVKAYAGERRPLLGICLGMHILAQGSEEGFLPGLGLFQGLAVNLRKLGCMGKVPHVGFNCVQSINGDSSFLAGTSERDFYFVHSFGLPISNMTGSSSIVEYQGAHFIAALHHENLFATQFHPEKSGDAGLMLLEYFLSCSRSA